jgi:hypothetical protein
VGGHNEEEDMQISRVDFFRKIDEGLEKSRRRIEAMFADLTPKERELLLKRFGVSSIEEFFARTNEE